MSKKFKLVQYPYGREMGFKQDIVWFIQGTDDNKTWNFYRWGKVSPAIVSYHCLLRSAYLTIDEANEAFDKITDYYREELKEKNIRTLREVEI